MEPFPTYKSHKKAMA